MAILIEAIHLISWRWAITDKEFNTLSDFSGVVFFIVVVYIFSDEGARGIFVILTVLPFILFPLLVVQKYSDQGVMKLSALIVSLRKLNSDISIDANRSVDISLPFLIACLVSASAGNQRSIAFFIAVAGLLSVVLWSFRPLRHSFGLWIIAISLALSTAYAGQIGIRRLQASVEASFLGIFDQFVWRYRDPNRATTAIGSLGRLKLSDRIVLRVKTKEKLSRPLLLREASYSNFGHGVWSSQNSDFAVIDQNADSSWTLTNNVQSVEEYGVSTFMVRERGVIPLPHGSTKIKNVTAIEIAKNPLGTVLMDIREGWVQYDVEQGERIYDDQAPNENDLFVLNYYQKDFARLAEQLNLSSMDAEQAVSTVSRFFAKNFTYSLNQKNRYPKGKYLAKFLFENRQGHCEYFATATALLLRSVGIPTRYVVGYSIDEYSALEGQYIARARHAHSWTLVHVNGNWEVLDTTPAIWAPYEEDNASLFEPLMDLWAWVSYTWALWQSEDATEEEENTNYLLWLLLPLIAVLSWRIYFKERVQQKRRQTALALTKIYPGEDSNFYKLTEIIESSFLPRHTGETLSAWLGRASDKIDARRVIDALQLHYKYRFDPDGISLSEQKKLNDLVTALLTRKSEWLPEEKQPG